MGRHRVFREHLPRLVDTRIIKDYIYFRKPKALSWTIYLARAQAHAETLSVASVSTSTPFCQLSGDAWERIAQDGSVVITLGGLRDKQGLFAQTLLV